MIDATDLHLRATPPDHRCPFPGCHIRIPRDTFGCASHLALLPGNVRISLDCAYAYGQVTCGRWGRVALLALREWERVIAARLRDHEEILERAALVLACLLVAALWTLLA